jgi:hypothetical protein
MALTLYGFHDRPHDFAVTKTGAALEDCAFILDFSRPLQRLRSLGVGGFNKWIGITAGFGVPVVHQAEQSGGYVIGVGRGEPYFADIPKLWKKHYRSTRTIVAPPIGGLGIIADFATHFPDDCK